MGEGSGYRVFEGNFVSPAGARYAIVVSRFNQRVTSALLSGAVDTLARHGTPRESVDVFWVPGAFEIPGLVAQILARGYAAIITLGAIVRGDTPHFDYVAGQTASGIAVLARQSDVPVIFGVLTCDTMAQAEDRAGGKAGNKGAEAALSALEMVTLYQALPLGAPAKISPRQGEGG